jgi:hypothetical protein
MIKVVMNHGRYLKEGFTSAIVNGVCTIRKNVVINDEARMTNVEGMTKPEARMFRHSSLVLPSSFVHSCFVIFFASA